MNIATLSILFETVGGNAVIRETARVENSAKSLEKRGQSLSASFMRLGATFAAVGVVINRAMNFAKQGEDLLFMANSAGIAAERFSSLALAAERLGGTRQGMASVMNSLSAGVMGLRRGEENQLTNAAMYYGLSLQGKNGLATPEEMLYNIAGAMEGLSAMQQADLGRMLGLDPGTLRLVQQGVAGVRREMQLAEKYNPFKDKNTMLQIKEFQYTLREMKMGFAALSGELLKGAFPHIERWATFTKDGIDYFLEHADAIKVAIMAIGTAIMAALGPAYLVATALFLLIDDYVAYSQGGNSALEPIWKKLLPAGEDAEDKIEEIKNRTQEAEDSLPPYLKGKFLPTAIKAAGMNLKDTFDNYLNPAKFVSNAPALAGINGGIFNFTNNIHVSGVSDPQRAADLTGKTVSDSNQDTYQTAVNTMAGGIQ